MSARETRFTEQQFAKIVGWHKESIARMRRKGEIDHCQKGRKVWYLPKHVDAFNQRFEHQAAA